MTVTVDLAKPRVTIDEMRRAHLGDREPLVRTHRQLTAVINDVRALVESVPDDPLAAKVLGVLGDTGVCTISSEDQR